MTSQYDSSIAQFNSILQKSQQAMVCGPDCQKKQNADRLKKEYLDSQINLETAPQKNQTAAKNYYTFIGGQSGYNDYITSELEKKANTIISAIKNTFSSNFSSAKTLSNLYYTQLINSQYTQQIYDKYLAENEDLENRLRDNSYDIFTNDRKTYYEDQGTDNLNWWNKTFFVLYCILVIAYVLFFFISSSNYSILSRIFFLAVLIIYPIACVKIINFLISIFYRIGSALPKNSYLYI
jgi:hypothetical protein